jgi:hypothetical protein
VFHTPSLLGGVTGSMQETKSTVNASNKTTKLFLISNLRFKPCAFLVRIHATEEGVKKASKTPRASEIAVKPKLEGFRQLPGRLFP